MSIFYLFLIVKKIEFKNKDHMLFFLKDTMIAQKNNSSYHSPHKSTLNESKLSM
jgi:hypothetical protein